MNATVSVSIQRRPESVAMYLGNPETVTQLVRDFFVAVFSARAAFQESADGDAANERINEVCRQMANASWVAINLPMPWNSPYRWLPARRRPR